MCALCMLCPLLPPCACRRCRYPRRANAVQCSAVPCTLLQRHLLGRDGAGRTHAAHAVAPARSQPDATGYTLGWPLMRGGRTGPFHESCRCGMSSARAGCPSSPAHAMHAMHDSTFTGAQPCQAMRGSQGPAAGASGPAPRQVLWCARMQPPVLQCPQSALPAGHARGLTLLSLLGL